MPQLQIVDTFMEFQTFWKQVKHRPLHNQIESWASQYMRPWPELRQKQIDCYLEDGDDWREIAQKHVFPNLSSRLPAMRTAHDNLLPLCEPIYGRCQEVLGFNNDCVCVIYVGIGCGAGWATTFAGKPAILFGLENIAEEGWQTPAALARLAAHELGHLVHFDWRAQARLDNDNDPWWQLYSEGFAQRCEHLIQGKESWHMQTGTNAGWISWCRENQNWLAAEFLRRVDEGLDIRPFFGSWFELRGHKQTGYFLGFELIKALQQQASLHEIALLKDISGSLRPLLLKMAR